MQVARVLQARREPRYLYFGHNAENKLLWYRTRKRFGATTLNARSLRCCLQGTPFGLLTISRLALPHIGKEQYTTARTNYHQKAVHRHQRAITDTRFEHTEVPVVKLICILVFIMN